jgi:arylsulfatase A-like enzyme
VVSIAWAHEFLAGLHTSKSVNWDRVRRLYDGDVHTADRFLAELVAMLKTHGLYETSVLIVASDHGENLGEHDLIEHQFSVHETLLAVPLVIRAPGQLEPGAHDEPVMLTDLFATILDLARVEGVPGRPHSRSLLATPTWTRPHDRAVIAEYSGGNESQIGLLRRLNPDLDTSRLTSRYKTVRRGELRLTMGGADSLCLHDLAADPGQMRNIAKDRPDDVGELLDVLNMELARYSPTEGEESQMDEETREKLRSLGYTD